MAEYPSGDMADMLDNHDFVYTHIKNLKAKLAEVGVRDCVKNVYRGVAACQDRQPPVRTDGNHQFGRFSRQTAAFIGMPYGNIVLRKDFQTSLMIRDNRTLLESLVNNLVVNAVRHNRPNGDITLVLTGRQLIVSNTSDEPELDARQGK